MQFAAADWLLAMVLIPAVWLAVKAADRRARRRARLLLGSQAVRARENWHPRLRGWQRFCYLAGLFWLILALARPQWGASEVSVTQRGHDVVIALDVSRSMLAQDVTPSRLERAKAELTAFLRRQTESRVGLVLFAGAAFVQCPLTADLATAEVFLQMAAPDMISAQGTALAAALRTSREVLQSGRQPADVGGFQAILLVTDGEDLEGKWEEEAQACRREGITVIPVGIGEEAGGLIPLSDERGRPAGFLKDAEGNLVLTRLDLASLERLAAIGGGSTFRVGLDGLAGERLRTVLSRLGQRAFEERRVTRWQERFHWPLALSLLCLGLAVAIGPRRSTANPSGAGPTASAGQSLLLLAALGFWSPPAAAQELVRPAWAGPLERGRAAYAEGDFATALREFERARVQEPNEARLALAVGAALYQLGRHEEAAQEFARAAHASTRRDLVAESLFNAGTTALAQGDVKTAIDHLRRSLRLEPDRADALHNLETALLRAQEQEQEQQDQDQGESQDQEQDRQPSPEEQERHQDADREDGQGQDQDQDQDQPQNGERSDSESEQSQPQRQDSAGSEEPPPGQDPADSAAADSLTMDRDQALRMLQALDRDDQELKRSVQQRLRGPGAQSGRQW